MSRYNNDIQLALRLPARYRDKIDFLKLQRGALTHLVCEALDSVEVDEEILRVSRENNATISNMLMTYEQALRKEAKEKKKHV